MPHAGDSYDIELKEAHVRWGEHRHSLTRPRIKDEGYIPIPAHIARDLNIFNGNHPTVGINLYTCSFKDGYSDEEHIKACGNSTKGDIYAKQFQGDGDLQVFGKWFKHVGAQVGDIVRITWATATHFEVEIL